MRFYCRVALQAGHSRPVDLDALLQSIVDGSADNAVIELYAGIRPDVSATNTSAMMTVSGAATGVAYPVAFNYRIGATGYSSAAVSNVVLTGPTIPAAPASSGNRMFGSWQFSIDASGTITCAPAAGNATGYDNRPDAIAALPAIPAGSTDIGYLVVGTDDHTTFVPGTSLLTTANYLKALFPATLVATYTLVPPVFVSEIDSQHITVHAVGGLVYQPRVPTFARVRYPYDSARYDLWVGTTGSGADLIIDNLSAVPSNVWDPSPAIEAAAL